jgi:hypothetical protein
MATLELTQSKDVCFVMKQCELSQILDFFINYEIIYYRINL